MSAAQIYIVIVILVIVGVAAFFIARYAKAVPPVTGPTGSTGPTGTTGSTGTTGTTGSSDAAFNTWRSNQFEPNFLTNKHQPIAYNIGNTVGMRNGNGAYVTADGNTLNMVTLPKLPSTDSYSLSIHGQYMGNKMFVQHEMVGPSGDKWVGGLPMSKVN